MRLLIHDLPAEDFKKIFHSLPEDLSIIAEDTPIHSCLGCFGCWIKTPGKCVIRDPYQNMGALLARSEELILISQCYYGSFSPFIKSILDRSISYIHPYFIIKEHEMHHRARYQHHFNLRAWFYGPDIRDVERETAHQLVQANATNLQCPQQEILFANEPSAFGGNLS
ncbi:MAG TPA: flavoprotein [Ruminococcaceae bacterium]|nr:flavoprotein [Oscillospiraceae bacterium]